MFDIGIIGAGPAGYTAAIRASQEGMSVVLFEKGEIGGTCLNRGCIPTKTILHIAKVYSEILNSEKYGITAENIGINYEKAAQRAKTVSEKIRKSLTGLIKGCGITIVEEHAQIENSNIIKTAQNTYEVKNIIIASGSKPNKISFKGNYDKDFILTSDDILNMTTLPESILIVGSGAIGIEWARILSAFKVKVSVVEIMEKLLPSADYEISARLERIFKKSRIDFYTSCSIDEIQGNKIKLSNGKEIVTEKVLLGAGRAAELDFGSISKNLDIKKYVTTDCNFKTNIDNIFAIGDINGKSMLAHSAMKQAEEVIEYIKTGKCNLFNPHLVPAVIYGSPEIAYIGKTEQALQQEGTNYKKSIFPISALGKAYAEDKIEGFIKILATEDEILGAHIISEEASAMIEQTAIAMTNKIPPKEIIKTIFAHPTYSEGIGECLLGLYNKAIHIPQKKEENNE